MKTHTHTRKLNLTENSRESFGCLQKKAFELKHQAVEASNDNPILAITFRQTNTAMETQSLEDVSMMYLLLKMAMFHCHVSLPRFIIPSFPNRV